MWRRKVTHFLKYFRWDAPTKVDPPVAQGPRAVRHRYHVSVAFGATRELGRSAVLTDLSKTGIGLATNDVAAIGEKLFIEITLPNHEIARVQGVVRWLKAPSKGLRIPSSLGVSLTQWDDAYWRLMLALTSRYYDLALELPPRAGCVRDPADRSS